MAYHGPILKGVSDMSGDRTVEASNRVQGAQESADRMSQLLLILGPIAAVIFLVVVGYCIGYGVGYAKGRRDEYRFYEWGDEKRRF